ncbi:MAG: hypothetical protein IPN69_19155 [Acidobacteria bacterium]|nr:hypothetical protein [Acidobacteriota bacterium]
MKTKCYVSLTEFSADLLRWSVFLIATAVVVFVGCGKIELSERASSDMNVKDPCWFMTLNDKSIDYKTIRERQDRESYGYSEATELSYAVEVFNSEIGCFRDYAEFPLLTVDELRAAVLVGLSESASEEQRNRRSAILKTLLSEGKLPKGSLIRADNGGRIQEYGLFKTKTVEAKGIRISLLLDLDTSGPEALSGNPSDVIIIRKAFSGIVPVD